jgi:hypothetical protein
MDRAKAVLSIPAPTRTAAKPRNKETSVPERIEDGYVAVTYKQAINKTLIRVHPWSNFLAETDPSPAPNVAPRPRKRGASEAGDRSVATFSR